MWDDIYIHLQMREEEKREINVNYTFIKEKKV